MIAVYKMIGQASPAWRGPGPYGEGLGDWCPKGALVQMTRARLKETLPSRLDNGDQSLWMNEIVATLGSCCGAARTLTTRRPFLTTKYYRS